MICLICSCYLVWSGRSLALIYLCFSLGLEGLEAQIAWYCEAIYSSRTALALATLYT